MATELFDKVKTMISEIQVASPANMEELEQFRIQYLGTKNMIKPLFGEMRNVPNEERKAFGQILNEAKNTAELKYQSLKETLESASLLADTNQIDLTAPGEPFNVGARHPVSIVMDEIIDIFSRIGFVVAEEREIEDDWHNFTAMNTPEDHPARDMQDTFYIKGYKNMLLRTHTSSVQSRVMTSQKPPIRIIAPGRVYRNETISARSHCQFHQVEGLYVDEGVSFADMKQILYYFAQELYGEDVKIRLRPSYFPFTEPSAEMDVYYGLADEHAYRMTKGTGWLEIMGCGMVDPAVLQNCGIDSEKYTGFAFGMGIERQAIIKYRVSDIRMFFENDVRFLKQFSKVIS
jgi:phenylalanyl-tRNA synthetase alpha chain